MASMAAAASHHHTATGSPLSPFATMMPHSHHPQIDAASRHLPQPPPAHMGIPPVHIETKAVSISAWMDFDLCKCFFSILFVPHTHTHTKSTLILMDC